MSYTPRAFPVQVDPKKAYSFGTRASGVACQLQDLGWRAGNLLVWWDPGSFAQQRSSGAQHAALDVMAPLGARIVAPRAGRVLGPGEWLYGGSARDGAGWSENGGWYVRIEADEGGTDYFSHMLERPNVRPGQRVRAGQVLGKVGQTGNASLTCPHLHYGVRDAAGRAVDPTSALEQLFAAGGWRQKSLAGPVVLGAAVTLGLGLAIFSLGRYVQD